MSETPTTVQAAYLAVARALTVPTSLEDDGGGDYLALHDAPPVDGAPNLAYLWDEQAQQVPEDAAAVSRAIWRYEGQAGRACFISTLTGADRPREVAEWLQAVSGGHVNHNPEDA